jgi:hypothetical protein
MMDFLFIVCILGVVAGLVFTITGVIEAKLYVFVGLAILAISGFGIYSINNTDPQRAVDNNAIHERVGIVTEVDNQNIEIDNEFTYEISDTVKLKFDTKLDGIAIGDSVKVKYLTGTVRKYAAVITPVTIIENGGN